jgi:hypothetical protein
MAIEDNCMMLIVISGLVLCGAYFRSLYSDWRRQQTANIEENDRLRLLYQVHGARFSSTTSNQAAVR